MSPKSFANPAVLEFYKELPFNYRGSVRDHVASIRRSDPATTYPVLAPLLRKGTTILDVGCGAGWLGNSLAFHHGCDVTGIDFNPRAIERAVAISEALGTSAKFEVADLFAWDPGPGFELVLSLGVLHHTNDCLAGVGRIARGFTGGGGHVFIGLYHLYGRRAFSRYFRVMTEQGLSEDHMFREYRSFHSSLSDDMHARSWFRDQVLHPHETHHTLREIVPVLSAGGVELVATSINRFEDFDSVDELYDLEPSWEEYGERMLAERRYFPGFFVVLGRKT